MPRESNKMTSYGHNDESPMTKVIIVKYCKQSAMRYSANSLCFEIIIILFIFFLCKALWDSIWWRSKLQYEFTLLLLLLLGGCGLTRNNLIIAGSIQLWGLYGWGDKVLDQNDYHICILEHREPHVMRLVSAEGM